MVSQFSRIMVVGSPLGLLICLALITGNKNGFYPVDQDFKIQSESECLLPWYSYLYAPVGMSCQAIHIVVHRVHSWVRLVITFLEACMVLSALWNLASIGEATRSVAAWFLHVLSLRHAGSSAGGIYYQNLGGNQEHWQWPLIFGGQWDLVG